MGRVESALVARTGLALRPGSSVLKSPFVCLLALSLLSAIADAAGERLVTVLTGRGSSIYYALGAALGKEIDQAVPGVKISVQGTKGAADNLNLLQGGTGDFAFASGDVLSQAWNGNEEAGFKTPLQRLRGIAALYPDCIQIVARADSGIRTLPDLRGKRISVGSPKSSDELNARAILTAAGLPYSDFAVSYLPFGESVELLKDGKIDALVRSAPAGLMALRDLASALDVVFVAVPPDVLVKTGNGSYLPGEIPANTYRGQSTGVPAATVENYLVTREDVDVDLVYAVTKALWTAPERWVGAHPAGKAIDRRHALEGMPIPLHRGAEKYYLEVKLIRPEPQRPPVTRPRG